MLNYIWLGLVLAAILIAGINDSMKAVTDGALENARLAVTIALGLIGIFALWLGIMRLAEKAGLIRLFARALRPVMSKLFPEVPHDHPAIGSMLMNMSANMLGLGNAATPFGLRAMKQLESLNPTPGTATNSMCTFLALNTSCIQFVPASAVAILVANGSSNPTAIIGTAFLATLCAATAAVGSAKILERVSWFRPRVEDTADAGASAVAEPEAVEAPAALKPIDKRGLGVILLLLLLFAILFIDMAFPGGHVQHLPGHGWLKTYVVPLVASASILAIPFLVSFLPLIAMLRGIRVYEEFVEGAKEGFNTAVRIIPYLVAILVAMGMFRAAGGITILTDLLSPVLNKISFPAELLPLALLRPLSGSGSLGLFTEIVAEHGADSFLARTAGTMYGSTETTFYVLAVYFGAVAIRRTRHAVAAGLIGDTVGILASLYICRLMFT